jgi:DNA-binding transcriptional LysR family regulator
MKLNDLDLNKLSTFLAVVEARGITAAARQLGRTPSAVSQSVSQLEASLGCKLFDRVGKELVLTRGGRTLSVAARGYQALLEQTLGELAGDAAVVNGSLRLGLFLGFPRTKSRELLLTFAERHPQASLRVVYAPQNDLETRLRKNQLDFVLSFRPQQAGADLVSTRLFDQELVLVTSTNFFPRGFSFAALDQTPIVDYYQSDPLIGRWLAHHYPGHSAAPRVRFWAATTDLVLELVEHGGGAGVLPLHMVRSRRRRSGAAVPGQQGNERLKVIGPRRQPLIDGVWLHEPRGAYRDTTQRAFRDVVLAVLAQPAKAGLPSERIAAERRGDPPALEPCVSPTRQPRSMGGAQ